MHNRTRQSGAIFIEAIIMLTLVLFIALGMAQQYLAVLARLEHYKLGTEIMLGAQKPAVALSTVVVSGTTQSSFSKLDGSTTPTMSEFLDEIGNAFLARASSEHTLFVKLGYVNITAYDENTYPDPNIGTGSSIDATGVVQSYTTGSGTSCGGVESRLNSFATTFLTDFMNWQDASQTGSPRGRIGVKLYNVMLNGNQYEEFIDFAPVAFLAICTETIDLIFPQTAVTILPLVPRRLTA